MSELAVDKPNVPTPTPQFTETLALAYKLGLAHALVAIEAQYALTQVHEIKPLVDQIRSEIQDYRAGFEKLTKGIVS